MKRHYCLLLILLGAVLTIFTAYNAYIPVTDPVESNYALTAKEMLISGDWLSPQIYGQYWFDKPALIYWLIALSYKIFGVSQFAARLPSAIFSILSIGFIYWFANEIYRSKRTAFFSAIILVTSLEFWVLGRMVITDAVLFFFNSVAMAFFYMGIITKASRWFIFTYICCALAVLTKGPIGIVLPSLIVAIYVLALRRWEVVGLMLKWQGIVAFLAVALPWNIFMYQVHGQNFLDTFLGLHNYLRATVSEHPQDNVWYYYLVLFPVSLLPWSGAFIKAMYTGLRENKSQIHFTYMFVWIAVTIGFYTMMATKYPTYVFPAMFPAALITGKCLEKMVDYRQRFWKWLTIPAIAYFLAVGYGVQLLNITANWELLYITIISFTGFIVWLSLRNKHRYLPHYIAIMATFISIVLIGNGLTKYANERAMPETANYIKNTEALIGYYQGYSTSAVFYSGNNIYRVVDQICAVNNDDVWSGKYTMPTVSVDEFARLAQEKETYILIKGENEASLRKRLASRQMQLIANVREVFIYKLD